MSRDQGKSQAALWRAFARVPRPEKITQEAYDFRDRHLRRLVRLNPGERAEAGDLWDYTQDLLYTEIQVPLLSYLLPFCLEAWREDLRGTRTDCGGFVEHFYPVLANRGVFTTHLTAKQTAGAGEFMRQAVLDEIDEQRCLAYHGTAARPHRWVEALTTYGVLLPDLDRLWIEWWSLGTIGRAIAAVQYVSCLMYPDNENPVFAPWTRDAGGGPPCLWNFAGHLYANRWLEQNIIFLKKALTPDAVGEMLARAVSHLTGQPELAMATQIQADFPLCDETVESRCLELPRLLEMALDKPLAWSK